MENSFMTRLGDTWDIIAREVYGSELYAGYLMSQNFPHLDTLVFGAGVVLEIPPLPPELDDDIPDWRRDD